MSTRSCVRTGLHENFSHKVAVDKVQHLVLIRTLWIRLNGVFYVLEERGLWEHAELCAHRFYIFFIFHTKVQLTRRCVSSESKRVSAPAHTLSCT